jgi:WD40 repeat protein
MGGRSAGLTPTRTFSHQGEGAGQSPTAYPTAPILRPETGMHTAPARRIDVDREERFLVSGSDDKTVWVWDPASAR